ncbi:MAG: CPBP family intramembrane metalloprotease [Alphaproteobacteria bacterium]|nr:CPBP family intramembrane metalloprotease [Alphaproteobacteria bacterium]
MKSAAMPTFTDRHGRTFTIFPRPAEALGALSPLFLGVLVLPAAITGAVVWWMDPSHRGSVEALRVTWLVNATANWFVIAGLYAYLDRRGLTRDVFRFTLPRPRVLALALTAFAVGLFIVNPIAAGIGHLIGAPMVPPPFKVEDAVSILVVAFVTVVMAPLAEEVLFRGLGVGYLLARGLSYWMAGLLPLAAFAALHLPSFGLGGGIFILLWGGLPTFLRLLTGSLTPGWVLHVLNNAFAYVSARFLI